MGKAGPVGPKLHKTISEVSLAGHYIISLQSFLFAAFYRRVSLVRGTPVFLSMEAILSLKVWLPHRMTECKSFLGINS